MLSELEGQQRFDHLRGLSAEIDALETRRRYLEQKRDEAITMCMKWVEELNASVAFLRKMQAEWRAQAKTWERVKKEQRLRRRNMTPEEKQMEKEKIEEIIRQRTHNQKIKKQIIFYERTRRAEMSL